jgi:DNA-binding transcriptional regulator LsrR (DeoR family)
MNDYTQKRASTARGMYAEGWTPYEISHALVISEATVLNLVAAPPPSDYTSDKL